MNGEGNGRAEQSPAWRRLEDQLAWYSARASASKRAYERLKVAEIVIAAAIPVAAAAAADTVVLGTMGGLIVVMEGLQQLFQLQQNWTSYRATSESLKHEKFLFLAQAGPYADAARPDALLAERVEGLVSQEHATWVSERRESVKAASAR